MGAKSFAKAAAVPYLRQDARNWTRRPMTKRFLDPNHPMFRRLWVRWLTVLMPLAWGGLEAWTGNPGWAILFLAAGAYAAKVLLLDKPGAP